MTTAIETLKSELREMERIFCETAGRDGASGWAKFFAPDGAMVPSQGDPITGPEAIEAAMTNSFALKNFKLLWQPMSIDVSPDGQLGYTYGQYQRSYMDESGQSVESTGKYMTVWKRQPDGQWRISVDIGN